MKKVFALLLALCLVFSMVACASKDDTSAPAETEQSADAEAPAETEASAESEAPAETETSAASGEAIKIGLYGTITGTNALAGEMLEKGARLAISQVNANGGINGRPMELVVYDDQSTPEGAVKAVTRLVDVDKVIAMVGSNSSPNIMAASQITEDAQVIQVGAGTSPTYTNAGFSYIFRGAANANLVNKAFVDALVEMGASKVAILSIASENGTSGVASTKEYLPDSIEIVCEEQYQPTDTDFTGQIAKILSSGADSIILYGTTSDSALAIKQIRGNGYTGYIYGPEALGVSDIINVAGDSANGVIFGSGAIVPVEVEDAANDTMKQMLSDYVAEYGEMPVSDVVYRGYDGAMLIAEALRNASDIDDPDSIREAFLNITDFAGTQGVYNFSDASGDGLSEANTYIVDGGKNVSFTKWLEAQ